MKQMNYGNIVCEVSVAENYAFRSEVTCQYDNGTVAYAVERFFTHCTLFCRECTYESWQIRIAKGKARRSHNFTYLIPAVLMELPGIWIRLVGDIDAVGVNIKKVELLNEHPCFREE